MRSKEHSGRVIKTEFGVDISRAKTEVYQPLRFLVERFHDDWMFRNNFVEVKVDPYLVRIKMGSGKSKYKEIDISREGAIKMAKLILAEYESQGGRFKK